MLLSVVIPAHNEADGITPTVTDLHRTLTDAGITHEILVVNDHSSDRTAAVVTGLSERIPEVRMVENHASGGIPDRVQQMAPLVPMQRAGSAEEVAQAIVWLLSDAASYTTGSVVDVTGGR